MADLHRFYCNSTVLTNMYNSKIYFRTEGLIDVEQLESDPLVEDIMLTVVLSGVEDDGISGTSPLSSAQYQSKHCLFLQTDKRK